MDLGLKDKVAIIGGASKGLGRACAEVLAREGAKVTICSRTQADLEQAADEIRQASGSEVLVFAGDLDRAQTITELVANTAEHFGRLDILVNNSGGPPKTEASTASDELWEIAVQRSLLFFARMCREAIPHLKKQGAGRIINVLSSSVYEPIHKLVLSGATRMGVVAYAKTLADELGPDNILVNNVCPGSILTERMLSNVTTHAHDLGISLEEALNMRAAKAALRRIGEPEEFAYLVAFLASDKASYISGTTIRIDGGAVRSLL
jgi:3-oxoacyl-[acyl-carrier protein] reductase